MAGEIDLAVKSGRVRAPTYEDIYGAGRSAGDVPASAGRRRFGPALLLCGAAFCAMLLVAQRQRVVKYAPFTAGAYAAAGLPVNARGLAFRNVKATVLADAGQKVLAVEGHVANIRDTTLNVPDLRVAVDGPDGRELYYWTAKSHKPRLGAGEEIYFRARLASPPSDGESIKVRFTDASAKTSR